MFFHLKEDVRGAHIKFFVANQAPFRIEESYMTISTAGAIRGLHQQLGLNKMVKPVSVATGQIVVVTDKPALLSRHFTDSVHIPELKLIIAYYEDVDYKTEPIFVPDGALIAYQAIDTGFALLSMTDKSYEPENDLSYNPYSLDISWPIDEAILVDRDRQAPYFSGFDDNLEAGVPNIIL